LNKNEFIGGITGVMRKPPLPRDFMLSKSLVSARSLNARRASKKLFAVFIKMTVIIFKNNFKNNETNSLCLKNEQKTTNMRVCS